MFTIQPTNIFAYLSKKRLNIPSQITRLFYTSWEDALWDILVHKKIQSGTILVPDFFCLDVIENMEDHGLKCEYYSVDQDFQTDVAIFKKRIAKIQPDIIVILHAVGIENKLFSTYEQWKCKISEDTILIEDSVHRIIDPSKITLLNTNHVVIDSLRKTVPLMGSNIYGYESFFSYKPTFWMYTLRYHVEVFLYWIVFQYYLFRAYTSKKISHNKKWNKKAEKGMKNGYDVIGDSQKASSGSFFFSWLAIHIDIEKIQKSKREQYLQYHVQLGGVLENSNAFSFINIEDTDPGLLRGVPILVLRDKEAEFIKRLRDLGVLIRYELIGCPWDTKQRVVYLPLGPHLHEDDIIWVAKCVRKAITHCN